MIVHLAKASKPQWMAEATWIWMLDQMWKLTLSVYCFDWGHPAGVDVLGDKVFQLSAVYQKKCTSYKTWPKRRCAPDRPRTATINHHVL